MLDSLFNKIPGLQTSNFIKKLLQRRLFSCEFCAFYENSIFSRPPLVVAFMSNRKGKRGKFETEEQGKMFQMKEENENM